MSKVEKDKKVDSYTVWREPLLNADQIKQVSVDIGEQLMKLRGQELQDKVIELGVYKQDEFDFDGDLIVVHPGGIEDVMGRIGTGADWSRIDELAGLNEPVSVSKNVSIETPEITEEELEQLTAFEHAMIDGIHGLG